MNLRQKTWGIFIKPYITYGGDKLVHRGAASVVNPCQSYNSNCTSYTALQGGEIYALYKQSTSFVEVRKIVKEIMDDLGYSQKDIVVTEIIPVDHIITPLA